MSVDIDLEKDRERYYKYRLENNDIELFYIYKNEFKNLLLSGIKIHDVHMSTSSEFELRENIFDVRFAMGGYCGIDKGIIYCTWYRYVPDGYDIYNPEKNIEKIRPDYELFMEYEFLIKKGFHIYISYLTLMLNYIINCSSYDSYKKVNKNIFKPMDETCGNCKYYYEIISGKEGECRFCSVTFDDSYDGKKSWGFPFRNKKDICDLRDSEGKCKPFEVKKIR